MYAILILRQYRLGGGLCLASGLYFLGIVKVLFPFLRGGDAYAFSASISPFHDFLKKCLFLLKYLAYTFFLPLAGAFCHTAAGTNMVIKLLGALNLFAPRLIVLSALCVSGIFALLYILCYRWTARTYYKIVRWR